jgi:hypothetical protein
LVGFGDPQMTKLVTFKQIVIIKKRMNIYS